MIAQILGACCFIRRPLLFPGKWRSEVVASKVMVSFNRRWRACCGLQKKQSPKLLQFKFKHQITDQEGRLVCLTPEAPDFRCHIGRDLAHSWFLLVNIRDDDTTEDAVGQEPSKCAIEKSGSGSVIGPSVRCYVSTKNTKIFPLTKVAASQHMCYHFDLFELMLTIAMTLLAWKGHQVWN